MTSYAARVFGIARSLGMYYGIPFRARGLRRFYSEFVTPGSLCFDIGSHAGNRVRCWRRLGARVLAVEPQTDFVRLLRLLYGRDDRVTVLHAALGSSAGRAKLLVSRRTPTLSTLSPQWADDVQTDARFRNVKWAAVQDVEVTTLQALIEHYGPPQFVKIDVEGYEAEVLAGLSSPIPALSFEYLPVVRQVALACVDRLAALGNYRYNRSLGETHRLAEPQWLDPDGIRRFLRELPPRAGSGDIYARLRH